MSEHDRNSTDASYREYYHSPASPTRCPCPCRRCPHRCRQYRPYRPYYPYWNPTTTWWNLDNNSQPLDNYTITYTITNQ